jgi:hypothetical protein
MPDEKETEPADDSTPTRARRPRLPESLAFDAIVRELEELPKGAAIGLLNFVLTIQMAREDGA